MASDGMQWMVFSILLLALPGALYNNANNSGLVVNPGTIGNCDPNLDICNITNAVGCQSNPAYCSLSGQSISFLSGNSPFTNLLTGNIFGLFSSLTSGNQNHNFGPFDAWGGGTYYRANCWINGFQHHVDGFGFLSCTQVNSDNSNMSLANVFTWPNWNPALSSTTKNLAFYHLTQDTSVNNTFTGVFCNNLLNVNVTASGAPQDGWSWFGCDAYASPPGEVLTNPIWSYIIAVPALSLPASGTACYAGTCAHIIVNVQPANFETAQCYNTFIGQPTVLQYVSTQCVNFYKFWQQATTPSQGVTQSGWGIITPLLTFLLGLVLFFIGTGIQIQAGGSVLSSGLTGGVGTNRQGTKLAQVMGLGLIVWSFLYSEFSFWFTSGLLPYGIDGTFGIIGGTLTGLFFFGAYKQATTS